MPSINQMLIVGHVGQSPKTLAGGKLVSFSVACSRRFKNKDNEWKEVTTWIPVKWWLSKGTEAVGQSLTKGMLVTVHGSFEVESYEKDGEKKTFTLCKAELVIPGTWIKAGQSAPSTAPQTTGGDYSDADYGDAPVSGADEGFPF
jgi:single-strand DNA-binding protein